MSANHDMTAFVESVKAQLVKHPQLIAAAKTGRYALAQVLTDMILIEAIQAAADAYAAMTDQLGDTGKRHQLARMLVGETWEAINAQ